MIKRQFDWTSCRCLLNTLQLRTSGLTCLVKYVWSAMNFVLCLGQQRNPWHGGKRWNPPSENVFDGLALPFYSISVIPGNPCHLLWNFASSLCISGFVCLILHLLFLSICISALDVSLAECMFLWLPVCLFGYLCVSLATCFSLCLHVCIFVCLCVSLAACMSSTCKDEWPVLSLAVSSSYR